MKAKQIDCPTCGAKMDIKEGEKVVKCSFCRSEFVLDESEMIPKEPEGQDKEKTLEEPVDFSLKCNRCGGKNIKVQRERVGTNFSGKSNRGGVRVGRIRLSTGKSRGSSQSYYTTVAMCKDCGYTWYPNAKEGSNKNIWRILLWIFFFPIMLTIWIWKTEKIKNKAIKIALTAVTWLLFLLIYLGSGDSTTNTTDEDKDTPISAKQEAAVTSDDSKPTKLVGEDLVDSFINAYNNKAERQITNAEIIDISKESGNYRTEYRLNAFKDACVKRGNLGNDVIDIVAYGAYDKDSLRVYVSTESEDFAKEVFTNVVEMIYPNITKADFDEAMHRFDTFDNGNILNDLSYYYNAVYNELFIDGIASDMVASINIERSASSNLGEANKTVDKTHLDDFFKAYVEKGNEDNIEDIAGEYGLFYGKINTGNKGYDHKVALTSEDAEMWALKDREKGDYYILISDNGDTAKYCNNIDMIEIEYSKATGIVVVDKTRLAPYEDGSLVYKTDSVDEAVSYTTSFDTEISPIQQFFEEVEFGMSRTDVESLIKEHDLYRGEGRSNSFAWNVYTSEETYGKSSYVYYVVENGLNEIDFYDYYVLNKYGYYITGKDGQYHLTNGTDDIIYETSVEAIDALMKYRK